MVLERIPGNVTGKEGLYRADRNFIAIEANLEQKADKNNTALTGTAKIGTKNIATTDKIDISPLLVNGWTLNGQCSATVIGGRVTINAIIRNGTNVADTVLFTLPIGFRPSIIVTDFLISATGSGYTEGKNYPFSINANGDVILKMPVAYIGMVTIKTTFSI